ncbi:MAG: hypothetical protein IJ800_07195, partial [Clostridia bacterium]|nr:hypothetical protein [Clostridia bacterium]
INGGTYNSKKVNGGSAVVSYGKLTINGGTYNGALKAEGGWPSYTINNYGEMVMNDAVVTSYHGSISTYGANATSVLNNVTATISPEGIATGITSHVIYTYENGNVTVNSGTYWNNAADANGTGGTVVCNYTVSGKINIYGGTFKGGCGLSEYWSGDILAYGGTYDRNVSNYVAKGYETVDNGDGTWTVEKKAPVNIGTAKYNSLQAAFDAVENNQTITVNQDLEITTGLVFNKDVTAVLDLGENKLKNSGKVDALISVNSGNLSVKNGTLENINEVQEDTVYGIRAKSQMTEISNVSITVTGTGVSLFENAVLNKLNANIHAYVETNGYCSWTAIDLQGNAKIKEITGGNYLSEITYEYFDTHRSSKSLNAGYCISIESGASIDKITDGSFVGTMSSVNYAFNNQGNIGEIAGGYFSFTEWNWEQTSRLFLDWSNVTSITGGTFVSGTASPTVFDLATGSQMQAFRDAITNADLVESDKTLTLRFADSSKDYEYIAKIYNVVPKA